MRKIILVLIFCFIATVPAWAEVQDVNVIPPSPPATPTSVTVSGITDTTATVSWEAVDTAAQYSVYVNGQPFTGSSSPGVVLTGLTPYNSYDVYIVSHNSGGDSGESSYITFKTLPPVPSVPELISISEVSESSAKVTWHPNLTDEYILSYRVYVDGQAVADIDPQASIMAANLNNLSPGKHTVAVSAINENKEGPLSKTESFNCTSILGPTGLKMTNHSSDTVWLNWDVSKEFQKYEIYYGDQKIGETTGKEFTITGLKENSPYDFSVVAVTDDGYKSQSSSISVTTLPIEPTLSVTSLKESILSYTNNLLPEITILFAVIAATSIARISRLSFTRRI